MYINLFNKVVVVVVGGDESNLLMVHRSSYVLKDIHC